MMLIILLICTHIYILALILKGGNMYKIKLVIADEVFLTTKN